MSIRTLSQTDLNALREWVDRLVFLPVEPEHEARPYRLDRPAEPGLCLDDWTFRYGLYEAEAPPRRRVRPAFAAGCCAALAVLLAVLPV
jgi:hypothetical protein